MFAPFIFWRALGAEGPSREPGGQEDAGKGGRGARDGRCVYGTLTPAAERHRRGSSSSGPSLESLLQMLILATATACGGCPLHVASLAHAAGVTQETPKPLPVVEARLI